MFESPVPSAFSSDEEARDFVARSEAQFPALQNQLRREGRSLSIREQANLLHYVLTYVDQPPETLVQRVLEVLDRPRPKLLERFGAPTEADKYEELVRRYTDLLQSATELTDLLRRLDVILMGERIRRGQENYLARIREILA
jgi:hypothetical protein